MSKQKCKYISRGITFLKKHRSSFKLNAEVVKELQTQNYFK